MDLVVRIGGFTLYGDRFHGHGFHIGPRDSDFSGWFDSPDVDFSDLQRPGQFGVFGGVPESPARSIQVSGFVVARSASELTHWGSRVAGLAGRNERLVVEADGNMQWADVRVRDVRLVPTSFAPEGAFAFVLSATNPRKYGASQTFPGASVQAFHYGNYPAVPVVEVAGPVAAPYTVASQGHSVTVTQALAAGETHRIDMSTGWVYRDGVLQSGVLGAADVFTIPPGREVQVTGPASMTVRVADTFI